jgi:hypothetical protein
MVTEVSKIIVIKYAFLNSSPNHRVTKVLPKRKNPDKKKYKTMNCNLPIFINKLENSYLLFLDSAIMWIRGIKTLEIEVDKAI